MRKLASVRRIGEVTPIENSVSLERAMVGAWPVVIRKGSFKEGDMCVYFEIDSLIPFSEHTEFLRERSSINYHGFEYARIKSIKLRGQLSQGLVLSTDIVGREGLVEGEDLTEELGVAKYERDIPKEMHGMARGDFPYFMPKSDAERCQNLTDVWDKLKQKRYVVTEKLEGTSAAFFYLPGADHGDYGCCSRNLQLVADSDGKIPKIGKELGLDESLKAYFDETGVALAIYGELIGPGVNKNIYKMPNNKIHFFAFYDINGMRFMTMPEMREVADYLKVDLVPVLNEDFELGSVSDLLEYADGASRIGPGFPNREGVVLRSKDYATIFKAISNAYLIGEK